MVAMCIILITIICIKCSELDKQKLVIENLNQKVERTEEENNHLLIETSKLEDVVNELTEELKEKEESITLRWDEIKQGQNIEGFIVDNIYDNGKTCGFKLKGYFVASGHIHVTEKGDTYMSFTNYYPEKRIIASKIQFDTFDKPITSEVDLQIRNSEMLSDIIGEDLYDSFNTGPWKELPVVAVFKDYTTTVVHKGLVNSRSSTSYSTLVSLVEWNKDNLIVWDVRRGRK